MMGIMQCDQTSTDPTGELIDMRHLWEANEPARFWQCYPEIPRDQWLTAARTASPALELDQPWDDFAALLELTLGEGRFGGEHWQLGPKKELYYRVKPIMPRPLTRALRQVRAALMPDQCSTHWPIDDRYARFQWALMRALLVQHGQEAVSYLRFWPQQKRFALVLTHDVETAQGQHHARAIADLEESLGFRSSFNFVPERYPLDHDLLRDLRARGFEVGVHGLNHDGRLFSSRQIFEQRAPRINHYLDEFETGAFRSPCTIRNPLWLQELDIEYDMSFFDTDPYEPISGGVMSIWPFMLGRFVELPYTLVQDYTLTRVLKETTPQIWLDKVEFIRRYHGMALINTHPDYLQNPVTGQVYHDFLRAIQPLEREYWHALPGEVAAWWRKRHAAGQGAPVDQTQSFGQVVLTEEGIKLC